MNKGIVYAATGADKHFNDGVQSAKSIKKLHPEINITMFTHKKDDSIFDNIVTIPGNETHNRNKFEAMINTPYDQTLYLDNDTYLLKPVIEDMFLLLEKFDMVLTHSPLKRVNFIIPEVPRSFPELNGGVILFSKTEPVINLLKEWEKDWKAKKFTDRDQPYLRKLMWESDIRFYILPEEYNQRKKERKKFIYHRGYPRVGGHNSEFTEWRDENV
jgi:hypothetical protein